MALTCNIDQRGRMVRGIAGTVFMILAIAMAIASWLTGMVWLWWLVALFAALGAFTLFEAANGWCVLRAMGIKTKI
ncbi:MAG TPA: hypothetical protein VKJ65_03645 [Phycisphaerae bacterium]|nr:hypothetical protein [Phycisphaerae bacterium]